MRKHIERHKSAGARVLALFDAFEEWFRQPDFAGCPFIRGLYDFNSEDDDSEIVDVIQAHFAAIQDLVTELLKAARPKDYAAIAPVLMSLLSGSIVVSQVTGKPDIARINRGQAEMLLKAKTEADDHALNMAAALREKKWKRLCDR